MWGYMWSGGDCNQTLWMGIFARCVGGRSWVCADAGTSRQDSGSLDLESAFKKFLKVF